MRTMLVLGVIFYLIVGLQNLAYGSRWTKFIFVTPAIDRELKIVDDLINGGNLDRYSLHKNKQDRWIMVGRIDPYESTIRKGYFLAIIIDAESCDEDGCLFIMAKRAKESGWDLLIEAKTNGTVYLTDRYNENADGELVGSWCVHGRANAHWFEWTDGHYVERIIPGPNGC